MSQCRGTQALRLRAELGVSFVTTASLIGARSEINSLFCWCTISAARKCQCSQTRVHSPPPALTEAYGPRSSVQFKEERSLPCLATMESLGHRCRAKQAGPRTWSHGMSRKRRAAGFSQPWRSKRVHGPSQDEGQAGRWESGTQRRTSCSRTEKRARHLGEL